MTGAGDSKGGNIFRWTGVTSEEVDISMTIGRTSSLAMPDFSVTSKEILDWFPNQTDQKSLEGNC